MILVRHASAGDSRTWAGDDRLRPLDEKGRRQADELVGLLAAFPVEEILTSPAVRCVETVTPLADARGLDVVVRAELGEGLMWDAGHALVHALAGRDVVVCGHGGLEAALEDPPKWHKGEVFVVDVALRVVDATRT
ncbi:MAG TPA: phosphoglycerate mutase family protein [Gaiellaceae bacterium]|nr:phosphoglycerate mutase family protein [Gaiellaceae bacterium]